MFSQIVAIVLVFGTVTAVPQQPGVQKDYEPRFARIINLQNDLDTSGAFSYSYETENGIKAEARGILNNAGIPEKEEQVVTGSFSFLDNGKVYSVTYVADANGFRAFGDHIPSSATSSQLPSPIPSQSSSPPPSHPPSPPPSHPPLPPPSRPSSPPQYPRSPLPPRPRDEVDDLARLRWDPQGLTPPPLPLPLLFPPQHLNPFPAEFASTPTVRSPRRRQQEFLETVIY